MQKYFVLLLFAMTIISCAAKKGYSDYNVYSNDADSEYKIQTISLKQEEFSDDKIGVNVSDKSEDRKIIYDAAIGIVTAFPDSVNEKLVVISKKFQGYVQRSNSNSTVIRVKSELLNEALASIAKLGKVQYRSIESEDITDLYRDLEIRLDNFEKSRKRYLELLDKAQNVGEILIIEKELERLNQEIDLLEGRLKSFNHLTKYSTISITIKEKVKPGIFGYLGLGLYHSIKWLFVRN